MSREAKIREIVMRYAKKGEVPDREDSLFEAGVLDSFALPTWCLPSSRNSGDDSGFRSQPAEVRVHRAHRRLSSGQTLTSCLISKRLARICPSGWLQTWKWRRWPGARPIGSRAFRASRSGALPAPEKPWPIWARARPGTASIAPAWRRPGLAPSSWRVVRASADSRGRRAWWRTSWGSTACRRWMCRWPVRARCLHWPWRRIWRRAWAACWWWARRRCRR